MDTYKIKNVQPEYIFYFFLSIFLSSLSLIEELYDLTEGQLIEELLFFVIEVPIYFILTFVIGYLTSSYLEYFDQKFKACTPTKRLLSVLVFVLLSTFLFTITSIFIAGKFSMIDYLENEQKFVAISFSTFLLGHFCIACFHEFIRYNNRKNTLWRFKRHFSDLNMRVQYDALKRQINPHFFFNSLAALSSLVYEDPIKSDSFIQKFSIVFRYIFKENHEKLISMKLESNFMDAYLGIVNVRFGAYLKVTKELSEYTYDRLIPVLTTQIIFDDIFHNNRIGKQNHLYVDIKTTGDNLLIRSNCNPKKNISNSNNLDFDLLKDRYEALGYVEPKISYDSGFRTISLPLISGDYEHSYQSVGLSFKE
ncbi:MAG: histidine kinase [Bacteroidota bacterium]